MKIRRLKVSSLIFFVLFCLIRISTEIDLSLIRLPEGFKIEIFANISNPRQMVRSDKGTIFVSTIGEGKVYAINSAKVVKILASGLKMPNGVALRNGNLYVAEVSRILRFDNIQDRLDNPQYVVVKSDLPTDESHGWKFIDFGPDGKLYIPIGAPCDTCDRGDPYATICRMNSDGTQFQVYARGIRNTVGFDWDPQNGHMWFTDNGRDNLGDDIPPDQLNYAPRMDQNFGYPYCHGTDIKDPVYGTKDCLKYTPPKLNFDAHSCGCLGNKYKGGMFIAQHGSWNRRQKIGYRVMFVKIDYDKVISSQVFADGWLQGNQTKGRPVDTEELSDGSLLVSDDHSNVIYRIYYTKTQSPSAKNEAQLSDGGKIAIIVGSIVGFIGLIILGFSLFRYCRNKRLNQNQNINEEAFKNQNGFPSSEQIYHPKT